MPNDIHRSKFDSSVNSMSLFIIVYEKGKPAPTPVIPLPSQIVLNPISKSFIQPLSLTAVNNQVSYYPYLWS